MKLSENMDEQQLQRQIAPHLCDENRFKAKDILTGILRGTWSIVGIVNSPNSQYLVARKAVTSAQSNTLLSTREIRVLSLVVRGHSNKHIAIELNISLSTVATYLRRAMQKLHIPSRALLIRLFPGDVLDEESIP
ncbi:MAG: helix-turn-helix transcriptional regulator [Deltaproteobacteria bacterium]|nr:helix-turn-helix transcriptional regulator [Deltaproteobacteria bacterium]